MTEEEREERLETEKERERVTYCLFMAGVALSIDDEEERKVKIRQLYDGALWKKHETEELEDGVNRIIALTNAKRRSEHRKDLVRHVFLARGEADKEMFEFLDNLARQGLGNRILPPPDQLREARSRQKALGWSDNRLMRHFGYRGIPIDEVYWEDWKPGLDIKVKPNQEADLIESMGLNDEQAQSLDELMARWKRLEELDMERGDMSEKRRMSEEVGELLGRLGLSAKEIQAIFELRRKMGHA